MNNLFDNLRARLEAPLKGPKLRSGRDADIQKFIDRKCIKITDRKTKQLRLCTPKEIAIQLSFIRSDELYILYETCEKADDFARMYWSFIRSKNKHAKATNQEANASTTPGRPGGQGPAQAEGGQVRRSP